MRGGLQIVVFPDADHSPASGCQTTSRVVITLLVARDLLEPVPAVHGLAAAAVIRTTMPEASVDKDGYTRSREEDVSSTPEGRVRTDVHAVSEPTTMQRTPQRKFGSRVPALLTSHAFVDRRVGRGRFASACTHDLDGNGAKVSLDYRNSASVPKG